MVPTSYNKEHVTAKRQGKAALGGSRMVWNYE